MSGLGPIELVIIVVIVVALFGPTLLAFWLGFTLGRKSSPAEKDRAATPAGQAAPSPAEPPAASPPTEEHPDE